MIFSKKVTPELTQTQALEHHITNISTKLNKPVYSSDLGSIHKALDQIHRDFGKLDSNDKPTSKMINLKELLKNKAITPNFLEKLTNLFCLCVLKKAPSPPQTLQESFEVYQNHRIKKAPQKVQDNLLGFSPASKMVILDHIQNLPEREQETQSRNIKESFLAALERKERKQPLVGDHEILHLRLGPPLQNSSYWKR